VTPCRSAPNTTASCAPAIRATPLSSRYSLTSDRHFRPAGRSAVVADLDHRSEIAASVGVLGRSEELDPAADGAAAAALTAVALAISRQIGFEATALGSSR
jgi:hypothetical protein